MAVLCADRTAIERVYYDHRTKILSVATLSLLKWSYEEWLAEPRG